MLKEYVVKTFIDPRINEIKQDKVIAGALIKGIKEYMNLRDMVPKCVKEDWRKVQESMLKYGVDNQTDFEGIMYELIDEKNKIINNRNGGDKVEPHWDLVITPDLIKLPGNYYKSGLVNNLKSGKNNLASIIASTGALGSDQKLGKEKAFIMGYHLASQIEGTNECTNARCVASSMDDKKLEMMAEKYHTHGTVHICNSH